MKEQPKNESIEHQQVSKRNGAKSQSKSGFLQRLVSISSIVLIVLAALLVGFSAGARLNPAATENSGIDEGVLAGENSDLSDKSGPEAAANQPMLHPAYNLTAADLQALLDSLYPMLSDSISPEAYEEIRQNIEQRPQVFLDLVHRAFSQDQSLWVLADKEHALGPEYAPEDLISLNEYDDVLTLNRHDLSQRGFVIPHLLAMVEAAAQQGLTLDISSSYRSYEYQDRLFQRWVTELGQAEAERISAKPGTSQHQLGTTMDFGSVTVEFGQSPAGLWMMEHAGDFGFSLSYPEGYEEVTGYAYEPWHFRYIGADMMRLQREFFLNIQQYLILFLHESRDALLSAHIEE